MAAGAPVAPPEEAGGGGGGARERVGIGVADTMTVPSNGTKVVVGAVPATVSIFKRFSNEGVIRLSGGAGRMGCCEHEVSIFFALMLGGRPRFPVVNGGRLASGRPGAIERTLYDFPLIESSAGAIGGLPNVPCGGSLPKNGLLLY